jgi:hypothetical protein
MEVQSMQEENNGSERAFDPYESFRGMRDAYLDSLSKTMIDAVNTESYAEMSGAMLDGYLTASAPIREALEKVMMQTLQQLSLPSRQEVAVLAQRFTDVEKRLDDMDAKLDGIAKDLASEREANAKAASQDALGEILTKALQNLSLASHQDVADLARSITNLEERLGRWDKRDAKQNAPSGLAVEDQTNQAATKSDEDKTSAQPAFAAKSPSPVAHFSREQTAAAKNPVRNANAGKSSS